jgi:6-pyruvoyltetrahydropterin/6-carboxytetrahydropterin synthase
MSYTITKDFEFSASHQLTGLSGGHPCSRLHGHNYIVRIKLRSKDLDATGFVVDYGELWPLRDLIHEELDHQHLNDVLDRNPTSENLAKYIHDWCVDNAYPSWPIQSVSVSETPKTWATYKP